MQAQHASELQIAILSLFVKSDVVGMSAEDKLEIASTAASKSNDLYDAISEQVSGKKGVFSQRIDQLTSSKESLQDSAGSFAQSQAEKSYVYRLIKAIQEKLSGLYERYSGELKELARKYVVENLRRLIPGAIKEILGQIAPVYSDIKAAVSKAKSSFDKAMIYRRAKRVSNAARQPVAKDVIDNVRSQVARIAITDGIISLSRTGMIIINATTGGIGTGATAIINASIQLLQFFKRLLDTYIAKVRYVRFQADCQQLLLKKEALGATFLRQWLASKMQENPIVACYLLSVPSFSSPFNFLDLTSVTPPPPSKSQRLRSFISRKKMTPEDRLFNYQSSLLSTYRDLQGEAKTLVASGVIALESTDPHYKNVLLHARGERVFIGCKEKDFDRAVKWNIKGRIKQKVSETLSMDNLKDKAISGAESLLEWA